MYVKTKQNILMLSKKLNVLIQLYYNFFSANISYPRSIKTKLRGVNNILRIIFSN